MEWKINRNWIRPILYLGLGLILGYFLFKGAETDKQDTSPTGTEQGTEIWTCSMHPQIRQPEPGLCPICEMDLIPAGSSDSDNSLHFQMTQEAIRLAQVETVPITGMEGSERILRLNGTIEADERRIYSQVSHIPGRIESLAVQFTGEQVRAGQRIATIYSPELVQAQREFLEALKLKEEYPEMYHAAREKLLRWKIDPEILYEIENTGMIREQFPVFAEKGGTVHERRVALGDYVRTGQVLYEILDLSSVWVLFDAYEQDLPLVQLGDRIEYEVPSVPGKTFSGRIQFIDPQLDERQRVSRLRLEQTNPGGKLKPGMFVKGRIRSVTEVSGKGLSVPRSAVLWTGKRSVVWVEVPDTETPVFEYREVVLGPLNGDHYGVVSGLEAGERVVARGAFTLDAAAQLNNQSSMINGLMTGSEDALEGPDRFDAVPVEFRQQLNKLIEKYIGLKDALVAADMVSSKEAIRAVRDALTGMDGDGMATEAKEYFSESRRGLTEKLNQMLQSKELEDIRNGFAEVSDQIIQWGLRFGVDGGQWYVQHCPMAMDDQGADWISEESAIRNPYFGDKMLKCGVVTRQIESSGD